MDLNPISHQEIEAFARLHKITLREWEIDAIIGIDGAFRAEHYEQQEKDKPKKKK